MAKLDLVLDEALYRRELEEKWKDLDEDDYLGRALATGAASPGRFSWSRPMPPWPAYSVRKEMVLRYAWAIPDGRALATIEKWCARSVTHDGGGLLEVGCGTGFWAYALKKRYPRLDIVATDAGLNHEKWGDRNKWFELIEVEAVRAVRKFGRRHPGVPGRGAQWRTLLMMWPYNGHDERS